MASSKQQPPEIRCCALVFGSAETNLHNLLPTLERDLAEQGMVLVAPPTPLRRETVADALSVTARAEICLLVFERSVSPDEYGFLYSLGVLQPTPDDGTVLFLTANRDVQLGPSFDNSFVVISLDDEGALRRVYSLATEIIQAVRDHRGLPLEATIARWRKSWDHALKYGEAVLIPGSRASTETKPPASTTSLPKSARIIEPTPRRPAIEAASPERILESSSSSDVRSQDSSVLPPTGPALYLSYAYEADTEKPIFDTARELRRRGFRAQIDRLGFIDEDPSRTAEQRYRLAVENSEWYVLFMTPYYFARANERGWTGVKTDLHNIEAAVLRDPFEREKIIPVQITTGRRDANAEPLVVLGLDSLSFPSINPSTLAAGLERALADQPRAVVRTVPIGPALATPQSDLVQSIIRDADWISQSSTRRDNRISVGALLLSMLHIGVQNREAHHSAAWLALHMPRTDSSLFRDFAEQYYPNWSTNEFGHPRASSTTPTLPLSYNAYSVFHWARLLAEQTSPKESPRLVCGVHLLASLFHRHAPWTAKVEEACYQLSLNVEAIREQLARDLPFWELAGTDADWQLWNTSSDIEAQPEAESNADSNAQTNVDADSNVSRTSNAVRGPRVAPAKRNAANPRVELPDRPAANPRATSSRAAAETRAGADASRPRSFGPWRAHTSPAGVSADDPRFGDDYLDITPDVDAFAKVLASWKLEPPLALGLFGEWGSGKTFFMKRLKQAIGTLSSQARAAHTVATVEKNGQSVQVKVPTLQKDEIYCKYIVQVEFNAWHYSEGDLWACLVDHIFTNLRLNEDDSETEVARRRKALLAQLKSLQHAGAAEDLRVEENEKAINEAKKQLNSANLKLEEAKSTYNALSVKDIWTTVTQDPKLQEAIKAHLETLGINTKNKNTAKEIRDAIDDAKSLGGRTLQAWKFLKSQRTNPYAYLAFFIAFAVPAALFALANSSWLHTAETRVAAAGTAVLSLLAGCLPIYRAFASRVRDVLDALDKPRQMAEDARRLELHAIENQITRLMTERQAAEQRKSDIELEKDGLQNRLDELNADRMLAEFLQDRAASDDYRKKLGTLALIRRDFERLADLMKSQRDEAMSEKPVDPVAPSERGDDPDTKRAAAIARAKQELDQLRVNRIVLYIDDLDRCSPKQVVDVLQAIHLLLAFPLFVVVVGVDARWVHRSIAVRSKDLLRGDNPNERFDPPADADESPSVNSGGIATPRDYLEKIFQVPFWLQPMSADACRNLIDGIIDPEAKKNAAAAVAPPAVQATPAEPPRREAGPSTPPAADVQPVPPPSSFVTPKRDTGAVAPTSPPPSPSPLAPSKSALPTQPLPTLKIDHAVAAGTPAPADTVNLSAPASTPSATPVTPAAPTASPTTPPTTPPTAPPPTPKPADPVHDVRSLKIEPGEITLMKRLSPLVGRSPRAVKRFINCYRLFKAVLPESIVQQFVAGIESEDAVSDAEIALCLLAVIVGAPNVASEMFRSFNAYPGDTTVGNAISHLFAKAHARSGSLADEWSRAEAPLLNLAHRAEHVELGAVRWIIDRTQRFSFHSASMTAEFEQEHKSQSKSRSTSKTPVTVSTRSSPTKAS